MTTEQYYSLVIGNDPPRGGVDLFNLEAAAELSGLHPEMILEFLRAHFVKVAHRTTHGDLFFDYNGIRRLRQIQYLRKRHHVNLHTIQLFVRLLDQLAASEQELRELRNRMR